MISKGPKLEIVSSLSEHDKIGNVIKSTSKIDSQLIVSPKNKLNDLPGKEWLKLTKSVWFQNGLGKTNPSTTIERQHPAPFSYTDIQKLILMFTKNGMTVLDPFCGVASSLKAAALCGRNSIGIEISSRWVKLGKARIATEVPETMSKVVNTRIIRGDCLKRLPKFQRESIDFIVTSPPYWNILNKNQDLKIVKERTSKGLQTKYSLSPSDLGNMTNYKEFLKRLGKIARQCRRVLKTEKFFALIVGDFRDGSKFYPYHVHTIRVFEKNGFQLQGIIILAQNNKSLFPYGYPYSFVENIHHQYVLIFQKPRRKFATA